MSDKIKHVVMIGTALQTQGGISTMVEVLIQGGLFSRCRVDYIVTHCDGGAIRKITIVLYAWLRFILHLLRGRVALLHAHTASRASFWRKNLFIVPAILAKIPVILHLHGGEFHIFYENECSIHARRFVRWVFERSDRVVVLSVSWQRWVRIAFPCAKVEVIFNPVALPIVRSAGLDKHGSEGLLFLGRLGQGKGTYDLLEAVALLAQHHVDLRARLGGDGEIEHVRTEAERLDIGKHVEVLGWVRGADKERLLNESAIFVLPSYNEGLPMSVLEAMAHGLPVVATPVGGIPEAITDGLEGFLVPPGDVALLATRLDELLSDAPLRERMGAAAKMKAEQNFSAEKIVARWVSLYRELGVTCDG